jgi:hypothetical protein
VFAIPEYVSVVHALLLERGKLGSFFDFGTPKSRGFIGIGPF